MKPKLQALLLADHVYRDGATGKFVIAGTFNGLNVVFAQPEEAETKTDESAPSPKGGPIVRKLVSVQRAGSPYVYISLTDIQGEVPLSLQYVVLDFNEILFSVDIQASIDDRFATLELAIPMPALPTPRDGQYALEVHCENQMLGSHRVTVRSIPQSPKEPQ